MTMSRDARHKDAMLYTVDESPPWYLCILLGFQHYLTMFGSTVAVPLLVTPAMCIADDEVGKSEIIGTIFFVSGMVTLLQTTVGCRLPVVQGATFSFMGPTFAILALPKWNCPDLPDLFREDGTSTNVTGSAFVNVSGALSPYADWRKGVWTERMREIQGAIIAASVFEVGLGMLGVIGIMLRFIGPLVIAPTIFLIGFALFEAATSFASQHWGISILTMCLLAIFSQYLRGVNIPCCTVSRRGCRKTVGIPVFKIFPVVLAVLSSWLFCYILTVTEVFPSDPEKVGYFARTDTRTQVLHDSSWFRFPYPGQWGLPTVSAAAVLGMLAGIIAGTIESTGDYYACARLCGVPPPPVHAINRGILVEGVGCILAGIWGSGNGTTTYSENIGAIAITKVGSRRVVQVGAVFAMLLGMLGKFGALFVSIPNPIVGGVFMTMFAMVAAIGISNLQFVDLNSSRNLFVFGFAMFFGFATPEWMKGHKEVIKTGSVVADQIVTVLLTTNMFVGGMIAFLLDNTVPGTDEERGILRWREMSRDDDDSESRGKPGLSTYDFPLPSCMSCLARVTCLRYVPFCPTFNENCISCTRCRSKRAKVPEDPDFVVSREIDGAATTFVNVQSKEMSTEKDMQVRRTTRV